MKATDPQALHKLPKNIYLEYIKLFPITQSPEIKTYTTIILTLIAVIGFSLFAITPTLQTIIELRRTLADSQFADAALEEKIIALQSLQQQYNSLGASLTRISDAVPIAPDVPTLLAKIQTLAANTQITVAELEALEVELTKKGSASTKPSSFVVTIIVSGNYDQTLRFLESLHGFDRIMSIDSLSISRDPEKAGVLTTNIRARAYFHPKAL